MLSLEGYFDVSYDRERKLIRITNYGFWNLDIVEQYRCAIAEITKIADQGCDALLNTCRTEIHSLEVAEALGRMSIAYKDAKPRRVAVVSPSVLLRMQTKRLLNAEPNYGYFDTEQAALEWLAAA